MSSGGSGRAGTINGQRYAFVHIEVTFSFGLAILLESIEYNEVVTDMRGFPAGYVPGEYSGTCKAELAFSEAHRYETAAASSGGFYEMGPIPVTITHGNPGSGQALIEEVLEARGMNCF